jgi:hypothetical protein
VREFAGGTKCQSCRRRKSNMAAMIRLKLNSTHTLQKGFVVGASCCVICQRFLPHYLHCTFSRSPHLAFIILFSQKTPHAPTKRPHNALHLFFHYLLFVLLVYFFFRIQTRTSCIDVQCTFFFQYMHSHHKSRFE